MGSISSDIVSYLGNNGVGVIGRWIFNENSKDKLIRVDFKWGESHMYTDNYNATVSDTIAIIIKNVIKTP